MPDAVATLGNPSTSPGLLDNQLLFASLPAVIALFGSVLLVWLTHLLQVTRERRQADELRKIRALEQIAEAIKDLESAHQDERDHCFDDVVPTGNAHALLRRVEALAAIHFPDGLDPEFEDFARAATLRQLQLSRLRGAILKYNESRPSNDPAAFAEWLGQRPAQLKEALDALTATFTPYASAQSALLRAMAEVARAVHGRAKRRPGSSVPDRRT